MVRTQNRRSTSLNPDEIRNPVLIDAELAKGRFNFIYRDSRQDELNVKHCFPLFKRKRVSEFAIRALMKEFDVDESGMVGYNAAGGLKIVVKMPEEELGMVKEYLLSEGLSETESTSQAFAQGIVWHGIVDGLNVHNALTRLDSVRPDPFQDFKWYVTIVKWQPIHVLKAFARARNMLQTHRVLEITLFDTLSGIQDVAQEKSRISGEPIDTILKRRGAISEIADEFCGGSKYAMHTTRTLTGAALRIKSEAMDVLDKIMNEEDPSVARKIMERGMHAGRSEEDIFDARAYKNIVSTHTIRGATAFLNAKGSDQANALMKLKNVFESNGYKCFQASRLNKETERCKRAHHQIGLMSALMGRDSWPEDMMDVERKLLLSTLFDAELDKYDLKTDTILPSLIEEYKQRMPLEAGIRWRLYCREREQQNNASTEIDEALNDHEPNEEQEHNVTSNAGADLTPQPQRDPCPLTRLNIRCLNVNLERFSSLRQPGELDMFHLVTGDPTQVQLNGTCKNIMDDRQADKFVAIIQTMLHSHGWVFLYTRAVDYAMWYKAFKANGFEPLEYAWPMVRNTDTVQANTSAIPQNVTELMIGARKGDIGVPDFQPDITSAYMRDVSSRKRKFAILDNCPEPVTKLKKLNSREPLRTNERSSEPIAEFIQTFCPPHGKVLDACAGTMETAKACFVTSKHCTALEGDTQCFDISLQRLKQQAKAYIATHLSTARGSDDGRGEHEDGVGTARKEVRCTTQISGGNCNLSPVTSDSERAVTDEDNE